ncbi:hypothetical protein [Pseudomonas sp. NPDC096950]|uniref:hypothetical protein n=1 Tax=Pseudomonas sp. NPDC096950 TaxID=3364485 RepID=UPI00383B922A
MMMRIAAGLLVHFFACVIYVVLNYYGVSLYKYMFGGLTSRGVSIGIAMYLIFYLFIVVNLIVALVTKISIKLIVLCFMMTAILIYLLPLYPVRAFAYSILTGGLTALAIFVSRKVDELILQRSGK